MLQVLAVTGPIYLAMLAGFVATRAGLFRRDEMTVFGRFVVNIALPALIFHALSTRPIREIVHPNYLVAYAVATLALVAVAYLASRRLLGRPRTASAIYAMGASCSNSGYVGFPILLLTMRDVAGVSLALNMAVENAIVLPILLFLAERGRGDSTGGAVVRASLARLARNPLILALVAGMIVSMSGVGLPLVVARTVELFALGSTALSLFVIGGTLVGLPLSGMALRVTPIAVGKLVVHPLAVAAAVAALPLVGLAPLDPALRPAILVMAAAPTMTIFPILAQRYGEQDAGAAASLLTTVASFGTLSVLLWLIG